MKLRLQITLYTALCLANWAVHAAAYKCTNPAGEIFYQAMPCPKGHIQAKPESTQRFSGPLETWKRFGDALNRGDKRAALAEMTSDLAQRFSPVLDAILSRETSFDISRLGIIRSVSMTGDDLAELTLVRKTAEGNQAFFASMLRAGSGKWLIAEM